MTGRAGALRSVALFALLAVACDDGQARRPHYHPSGGPSDSSSSSTATGDSEPDQGDEGDQGSEGDSSDDSEGEQPPLLDFGEPALPPGFAGGCSKVDLLFALDGGASYFAALSQLGQNFAAVVDALQSMNGGGIDGAGIDLRIGVTDDNGGGFMGLEGGSQWVSSEAHTPALMAEHFASAAALALQSVPLTGCDHALTSAVDLIDSSAGAEFMREDALLVIAVFSDGDDYDPLAACVGCEESGEPVPALLERLQAAKGDGDGVAALVIAGDPASSEGDNVCAQPWSCGGWPSTHADRLYEFAELLGPHGFTDGACSGVPFSLLLAGWGAESIEGACEAFDA